ncbi:MAG: hypothetical protein JST64_15685 [Actinobacteria bacterium]|nr:hypothetical protein [Actinomycetota bacterium]
MQSQRSTHAHASTTDPQGHVAIDSSGMVMSAERDPVTGVGDTFVLHLDREALDDVPMGRYDVTIRIVTFEPDREIVWTVEGQLNIGHVYGYRLAPGEESGTTLATSYCDRAVLARTPELLSLAGTEAVDRTDTVDRIDP